MFDGAVGVHDGLAGVPFSGPTWLGISHSSYHSELKRLWLAPATTQCTRVNRSVESSNRPRSHIAVPPVPVSASHDPSSVARCTPYGAGLAAGMSTPATCTIARRPGAFRSAG